MNPAQGRKRPTLIDVSRLAGVFISSVSRILNDPKAANLYAEATRRKVNKTAKELGYRPNRLARSNRNSRTNQVGMVLHFLPDENDPSYHSLDFITGGLEVFETLLFA